MNKNDWPVLDHSVIQSEAAVDAWLEAARTDGAVAFIDKDEHWTSFDCVAKMRSVVGIRRIGHAGTLDPLATGLLIVCFGRTTKDVESFQESDKVYDVVMKVGARTDTDDREGVEEVLEGAFPEKEAIEEALQSFTGTITQIPPSFSAVRLKGKRLYQLARKGRKIMDVPRVVTIESVTNVSVDEPFVRFTMTCSRGTYVRSLVRDVGRVLDTGAYVWELRRTFSGDHSADGAVKMSTLKEYFDMRAAS